MSAERPRVLCFSGHDPTGGAGILADAHSVHALGGHALCVITANTVQDSHDVRRVASVPPILLAAQVEALLGDTTVAAIKVGLVGDAGQLPHILAAIARTRVPVVVDPVLSAGGGASLATARTAAALAAELFPHTEILTPNAAEARRLAPGCTALDDCGARLLDSGARHVLITGGDEPGDAVVNRWYTAGAPPRAFTWPRLAGGFHGAGCTLAAAIAALRARGLDVAEALAEAQRFTHAALARAYAVGSGRRVPDRCA